MSLVISLEICFVAILGGIGTLWGRVLGAFVIAPLTELLRAYLSGVSRSTCPVSPVADRRLARVLRAAAAATSTSSPTAW